MMTEVVPVVSDDDGGDQRGKYWTEIQAELRSAYGEDIYSSWFKAIEYERSVGDTVELSTPTQFIRHWNTQHYGPDILKRWQAASGAGSAGRPIEAQGPG